MAEEVITMNQTEQKGPPGSNSKREHNANDESDVRKPSPYANYVHALTAYYTLLIFLSLWLLVDTVLERHTFLEVFGFSEQIPRQHVIRTIIFVATGALLGSVLYQIQQLYRAYCKPKKPTDRFNPRWLGKYVTAPWEAIGLALIVVALIGGGVVGLGGTNGVKMVAVSNLSNFTGFGLGGLLGFGIREVVGWLGNVIGTMFPTKNKGSKTGDSVDRATSQD